MDVKDEDFGEIQPEELIRFMFKPKTQISCVLKLVNKSNRHMAFKVKTTHAKLYCVKPCAGIIEPWSTCEVKVTRQSQPVMPLPCEITKERFLFERAFVHEDTSIDEISSMFCSEEWRKRMNTKKLKVVIDHIPKAIGMEANSEGQDVKVKETQKIISMESEIQELNSRLKKAEETILELMEQKNDHDSKNKKKHPGVFIKCFNMKFV